MGYHITILRTEQGKNIPIRIDEIKKLKDSFPGSDIEPPSLKGGQLDLVISRDSSHSYRFILQHGRLWTKNPEDDEIEIMLEIAKQLNARVLGDELETFRTVTDTYLHPDDIEEFNRHQAESRHSIRHTRNVQWAIKFIALLFLVIGLLISCFR